MQTEQITVTRADARQLYRDYRKHQHWSQPIDHEIQRVYQLIAQGRMVIKALESVTAAGLGDDKLPKLAIVRADATECWLRGAHDGGAVFASCEPAIRWGGPRMTRHRIAFPSGSFPGIDGGWQNKSIVPLIPVNLRPRRGIENYHILYEAEWRRVVPVDPMLLRRIGKGDLWVVCAAWDLTEVERVAMQARVSA